MLREKKTFCNLIVCHRFAVFYNANDKFVAMLQDGHHNVIGNRGAKDQLVYMKTKIV